MTQRMPTRRMAFSLSRSLLSRTQAQALRAELMASRGNSKPLQHPGQRSDVPAHLPLEPANGPGPTVYVSRVVATALPPDADCAI